MVYVPPKLNMNNHWYFALNMFLARAYIRIPLIIGGAWAYNRLFLFPWADEAFSKWNAGHTQKEMWDAVEARTKLRQAGAWEAEAEKVKAKYAAHQHSALNGHH
jgi:hypothetical protein